MISARLVCRYFRVLNESAQLNARRIFGAIACRTFALDRFHGWLSHWNLSGARLSWALRTTSSITWSRRSMKSWIRCPSFIRSLSARSSCSPSPLLDIVLKGGSVGGCVSWSYGDLAEAVSVSLNSIDLLVSADAVLAEYNRWTALD